MKHDLSLKPKEWHPLGEHNRIRCLSLTETVEGQSALMDVLLEVEWQGEQERIQLSSDSPEFHSRGLRFLYKGGGAYEAQIEIYFLDYV